MEKSDLMNEYGSFFSTSKENIKSVIFLFLYNTIDQQTDCIF